MTAERFLKIYLTQKLELTNQEKRKLDYHKEKIKKLCQSLYCTTQKSSTNGFVTGSCIRNTIIRPPKDLDFFVVLDKSFYLDISPKKLLSLVCEIFSQEVKTELKAHSIGIELDDGFTADIIPAFFTDDGMYMIPEYFPKKQQKWILSNPTIHNHLLQEINGAQNNLIIPTLKILKAWRRNCNVRIKSFHLETLLLTVLFEKQFDSLLVALSLFFKDANKYSKEACLRDPANPQNCIDSYLKTKERVQLREAIVFANSKLRAAVAFEGQGHSKQAIKMLEIALGL